MTDNMDNTTDSTETGSNEIQENKTNQAERTFTQEDVDRIVQNRLKQVERKFEGINIDEYKTLKEQAQQRETDRMIKKEQFEELLQKQRGEYESQINALNAQLTKTHIDGALLNAAAKHKAVNPEHVANLLRNNIRLGEGNAVEVLDADGNVRYDTKTARAVSVDDAVVEFLNSNPYFKAAQPPGSGSAGNKSHSASREVNISDLDMSKPEDRARYAEYRKKSGIA